MVCMKELLVPYKCHNKIRIGPKRDGGYVLAGDLIDSDILLSLGCNNSTKFEEDFLSRSKNPSVKCEIYDVAGKCDLASKDDRVSLL